MYGNNNPYSIKEGVLMIKIITILILLSIIGCADAGTIIYENTTNIIGRLCLEKVGGSNVVTLHPHYIDHWFSVYNDGHVTYQVYAYNYIGIHDPPYMSAFIGAIEPGQMGVLNNNASYYLYATMPLLSDLSSETVEKKINQYWYIAIIGIIIIIFIIKVWKVIK
jgi:hypothetical protein